MFTQIADELLTIPHICQTPAGQLFMNISTPCTYPSRLLWVEEKVLIDLLNNITRINSKLWNTIPTFWWYTGLTMVSDDHTLHVPIISLLFKEYNATSLMLFPSPQPLPPKKTFHINFMDLPLSTFLAWGGDEAINFSPCSLYPVKSRRMERASHLRT